MIISITNTSTEDYSANSFGLPAGSTIYIDTGRGDDFRVNSTNRVSRMTVASGYVNPFGGNAADVPQYDANGTAAEKLLVQVWLSDASAHDDREPAFSNR